MTVLDERMTNSVTGNEGLPEDFFPGIKELHARYERLYAQVCEYVTEVPVEDLRAITLFNLCAGMDTNGPTCPPLIVPKSAEDSIEETLWQQARDGLLNVEWDEEQNSPRFKLTTKGTKYAENLLGATKGEKS